MAKGPNHSLARGTALIFEGRGMALEQCITFRRTFDEYKTREIIFQEGGAVRLTGLPFFKHYEKYKGDVIMASHAEMDVE